MDMGIKLIWPEERKYKTYLIYCCFPLQFFSPYIVRLLFVWRDKEGRLETIIVLHLLHDLLSGLPSASSPSSLSSSVTAWSPHQWDSSTLLSRARRSFTTSVLTLLSILHTFSHNGLWEVLRTYQWFRIVFFSTETWSLILCLHFSMPKMPFRRYVSGFQFSLHSWQVEWWTQTSLNSFYFSLPVCVTLIKSFSHSVL